MPIFPDRERHLFQGALLLFFVAKLYLVLVGYLPAGMPRMGDDALTHLWGGKLAYETSAMQLPAIADAFHMQSLNPQAYAGQTKSLVNQVGPGTDRPLANLIYGGLLHAGLSLKNAEMVFELVVLFLVTAAFGGFLHALVGPGPAAVGLVLLAFAVFPGQGIDNYIPSTLALALGVGLWAMLYRFPQQMPLVGAGVIAFLAVSIHPMGKIHVLLAIPCHVLALPSWREALRGGSLALYGALLTGIAGAWLWPWLWPPFAVVKAAPATLLASNLDLLVNNLRLAASLLVDPILRKNPLLIVLGLWGFFWCWRTGGRRAVLLLLLLFALLVAGSLLHNLPGYPAELFTRMWVPFALVLSGVAGIPVMEWGRSGARRSWRQWGLLAIAVGMMASAVLWFYSFAFQKLNERVEELHEQPLRESFARWSSGVSLVYTDTDHALLTGLLLGAERLGVISYPALRGSEALSQVMEARHPPAMVSRFPKEMNVLSNEKYKTFTQRRFGYHGAFIRGLTITADPSILVGTLWVYVSSQDVDPNVALVASFSGGEVSVKVGGQAGWVPLRLPRPVQQVEVTLPDQPVWILGLRWPDAKPEAEVRWPWREQGTVTYALRHPRKKGHTGQSLHFTPRTILNEVDALELLPWVHEKDPVREDAGGLIILNTRFSETPAAKE